MEKRRRRFDASSDIRTAAPLRSMTGVLIGVGAIFWRLTDTVVDGDTRPVARTFDRRRLSERTNRRRALAQDHPLIAGDALRGARVGGRRSAGPCIHRTGG